MLIISRSKEYKFIKYRNTEMLTQIHLRRSYSLLRLEIKRTYPNIRHTVTLIQYLILNII